MQVRRSALYVPVNNVRALAKAPNLNVDVLIYDFEDAILADQKDKARINLATHLKNTTHQAEVILRINPVYSSAFYEDINWLHCNAVIDANLGIYANQISNDQSGIYANQISNDQSGIYANQISNDQSGIYANLGIDGLLLPKVRSADEILLLRDLLAQQNLELPIWLLVETIDAVINLAELVNVLTPGSALVLGAEDLSREMHISHTPGRLGLLPVLTQLVLHGRKANLSIIDAIYSNLENQLGFIQSCEQARNLGFDGKSLIHPSQISAAHEVFSPNAEDIENAQQLISAWEQKPDHLGVISVAGQVVEALHVNQAKELLEFAKQIKN